MNISSKYKEMRTKEWVNREEREGKKKFPNNIPCDSNFIINHTWKQASRYGGTTSMLMMTSRQRISSFNWNINVINFPLHLAGISWPFCSATAATTVSNKKASIFAYMETIIINSNQPQQHEINSCFANIMPKYLSYVF